MRQEIPQTQEHLARFPNLPQALKDQMAALEQRLGA
jgi:hypothetical protein